MKRVASLYLPDWSIDRLRRAEPALAPPPPERVALDALVPDWAAIKAASDAEQGGKNCDAPRNTGWRPGARWAREEVARQIATLPAHQRPPMREMGRRSEAADHPYKRLPGDDGGKATGWPEPAALPCSPAQAGARSGAVSASCEPRATGPRPAPGNRKNGSNDPGAAVKEVAAFFDTARSTSGTVSRVCPPTSAHPSPTSGDPAPPLVTVHKVGSRVEVAAASPSALALGVAPGMPLTQVRAAVPDVVVRDADPEGDACDLRKLSIALARRWTPVVAVADAQTLFLDLTGVSHLHGGEEAMARRLVRLLARLGFAARVGIADTAGAAWACAHFAPSAITSLPPGDPLPALAPLPVAALRVEEHAQELLRRLGVETVGQLAALPRAPLVRRFGRTLALRLDQAAGRASEPLDAIVPPVAIMVEQRFAEPLLTAEPIAHWIGQLVSRLAVDLARAGRGARAVVLAATRIDRAVQTIRIGFARPTRAPDHMLRLLVRQVDRLDPGFGIEALALHVQRADPLGAEAFDGDLADGERPDLAPLIDAIVNRIGQRRLWRMAPVESDVPERGTARAAPLDPPADTAPQLVREDVRRLDTRPQAHPWHPRWPRPARLLRRPEPLDHVMAEMPDYPPARFTWRGITHRVVRGDGPERITGEWWRRPGEASAVRDYFRVEDEAGARFWLFRRGDGLRAETGDLSWYIHGTFG
ncbi:DNA polymerase Y family protein [Sphingomonas adhaesiva]|uniref:DNA polymerase Y family protein n=1 Tax=Sphingomonas adhaesiva TaxID=28212 RepID=UPI002FF7313D